MQTARAPDPTELYPQERETTIVRPAPAPLPAPEYRPQQRSAVGKALAVIGTILVIILVASVKIGMWLYERQERSAAQSENSRSQYFAPTPSPVVTREATPESTPSPTEPIEKTISAGTYQCEFNRNLNLGEQERAATLKLRIAFAPDNTYLQQGFATIHGTPLNEQLIIEEKGNYTQSDDTLLMKNRLEREIDYDTFSWKLWNVPKEGSEVQRRIRNVTTATFQMFDPDENAWFTFTKT